jgi:hypothetical protein
LAPFKKLAQTFRQHWAAIVSYFECRITQGAIEAINGIIQLAKRRARGFRNFLYPRTIAYWRLGMKRKSFSKAGWTLTRDPWDRAAFDPPAR